MRRWPSWRSSRDDDFARALLRALGPSGRSSEADVRRRLPRRIAEPFAREVAASPSARSRSPRAQGARQIYWTASTPPEGPRGALLRSPRALPAERSTRPCDDGVRRSWARSLLARARTRRPAARPRDATQPRIHFRATLIMPGPIVRANTCAQGDTATWEFDRTTSTAAASRCGPGRSRYAIIGHDKI